VHREHIAERTVMHGAHLHPIAAAADRHGIALPQRMRRLGGRRGERTPQLRDQR
jgi:hypothetical protein